MQARGSISLKRLSKIRNPEPPTPQASQQAAEGRKPRPAGQCPKSSSVNRKSDRGVWTPRRALKCTGLFLVGNSRYERSDYLEESDLLYLDKESRHPQASKLPELKNGPDAGLNQTFRCFSFNVYYSLISLATRRDRGVASVSGVRIIRGTRKSRLSLESVGEPGV
jgi:hypothetical protein